MRTQIIKVDTNATDWDKQLDQAAEILRSGGLVAFPPEQYMGWAPMPRRAAVEAIYRARAPF